MTWVEIALAAAASALVGTFVPWLSVRMLVPSLRDSERATTTNYRGEPVFYGLGVVWLVWAGCAILGGIVGAGVFDVSSLPVLTIVGPLALVAFALGLVDDAYGSGADRGFRGHIKAALHGRLTTGGMKLLGISAASFVVALILAQATSWGAYATSVFGATGTWIAALLAGAAIALTSNFVNLTDLRPGRALKAYAVLVTVGLVSATFMLTISAGTLTASESVREALADALVLAAFVFGPVVATWRYDLAAQGMLGDAGANAMGAVAGVLIVIGLPFYGLVAYLIVMFALNLASERISFSRIIESTPALAWFDRLGRSDLAPAEKTEESKSSPEHNPDRG